MQRFRWVIALGGVVAVVGVGMLVWGFTRQSETAGATHEVARTPVVDPESLAIYSNGTYGFTFFYPATARIEDATSSQPWRGNAAAPGAAITNVELERGEVRIGASADEKAVSACTKQGPSEHSEPRLSVSGITWDVFAYDLLGTEDQRHVTSYRTLHDSTCFAVETVEPFEVATTTAADAAVVVRNFSFVR